MHSWEVCVHSCEAPALVEVCVHSCEVCVDSWEARALMGGVCALV